MEEGNMEEFERFEEKFGNFIEFVDDMEDLSIPSEEEAQESILDCGEGHVIRLSSYYDKNRGNLKEEDLREQTEGSDFGNESESTPKYYKNTSAEDRSRESEPMDNETEIHDSSSEQEVDWAALPDDQPPEIPDEKLAEYVPIAFKDYQQAKAEAEEYDKDDPSHQVIAGRRKQLERAVKRIQRGQSEPWKEERNLEDFKGNAEDAREIHGRYIKLESFGDWVNKAEAKHIISEETADFDRQDNLHRKSSLNTTAAMKAEGYDWDDVGIANEGYINAPEYAECPELEKLMDAARGIPYEHREDVYDEQTIIDENIMDDLKEKYLPRGYEKKDK